MQEIPIEELEAADRDNAKIVNLFHYAKDPQRTHGVPCKFVLYEGEPFSETKKRIQLRIGASEKDFSRFKFSLVTATIFKQPTPVEEGESLVSWMGTIALTCFRGYHL
jgi:ubiquitin carboxyl-terminal hydrolase 7